jgi:hypothetical protein
LRLLGTAACLASARGSEVEADPLVAATVMLQGQ